MCPYDLKIIIIIISTSHWPFTNFILYEFVFFQTVPKRPTLHLKWNFSEEFMLIASFKFIACLLQNAYILGFPLTDRLRKR